MRLCIITYKIISLDILTWVYNVCIFNNDKRRSYDRELNPEDLEIFSKIYMS